MVLFIRCSSTPPSPPPSPFPAQARPPEPQSSPNRRSRSSSVLKRNPMASTIPPPGRHSQHPPSKKVEILHPLSATAEKNYLRFAPRPKIAVHRASSPP